MRARSSRWGNSLALRVPRQLAEEAGLREDAVVELTASTGGFAVAALPSPVPPLAELLAQISDDNQHAAVDTGSATGAEAW